MFEPINPKWLSPGFDNLVSEPLLAAYDLPDYPQDMTGDGNWVDMYLDEPGQYPVGRLWMNPEADSIGLEELPGSNTDFLTRDALQLRIFHDDDAPVYEVFEIIKDQYFCDTVQTGDLSKAVVHVSNA